MAIEGHIRWAWFSCEPWASTGFLYRNSGYLQKLNFLHPIVWADNQSSVTVYMFERELRRLFFIPTIYISRNGLIMWIGGCCLVVVRGADICNIEAQADPDSGLICHDEIIRKKIIFLKKQLELKNQLLIQLIIYIKNHSKNQLKNNHVNKLKYYFLVLFPGTANE